MITCETSRVVPNDGAGAPRFMADIQITCEVCEAPFRFIGLPHGVDLNGAAVSADGCEGRFAIAPAAEVLTMVDGVTGFSARRTV